MKILDMKAAANPGGGSMVVVAHFDLQITADIRIHGMRLLRAADGKFLTYSPTALGGRRSVTFAPETTAAITEAATRYFQELVTADATCRRTAAA